jgi:YD repeat-containing protein
VTAYAYDAADEQVSVTDPDRNVTTTTFDALGRPPQRTDAVGTTTFDAGAGAAGPPVSSNLLAPRPRRLR